VGFYQKLGFSAEGPEFMEAGIPHRQMRRCLALGK
jgi:predicted GNAT family N-acyltransferase